MTLSGSPPAAVNPDPKLISPKNPHYLVKAQDELLLCNRTDRPAGDAGFVELAEKLTGRDLSFGKPGQPNKDNS